MVAVAGNRTDLAVDALAVFRLTRLATADTLLHQPREAIVRAAYQARVGFDDADADSFLSTTATDTWAELAEADGPAAPKLATLVTCRWCASVWLAAAVYTARRYAPRLWGPVAHVLAGSAVGTLLAGLEAD